ncbi:MAG: hypothetical protein RLZZ227_2151 [Pseudomonadota bacterium]|jgi:hypothetical protein
MVRFPKKSVALLLTAFAGSGALAFSLAGQRWLDPVATMYIGMSGSAPSGIAWSTVLRETLQRWNDGTDFTFVANESYADPCAGRQGNGGSGYPGGNGDGRNGMDFRSNVCGNSFGSGVLAVTLSLSFPGKLGFPVLDQTDIVFNQNLNWDVYDGPRRTQIDFRRVALHELGHALGLDHERSQAAIMAPTLADLYELQADDIAGANAMYSLKTCQVRDLAPSGAINDSLNTGDCRVRDAFGGSSDTSFVDIYRLKLDKATDMDILVHSSELDPVLILTDAKLGGLEIHDDFQGSCDARLRRRLQAGEYRILVNTYEQPQKCGGNTGAYSLTLTGGGLPLLGSIANVSSAAPAASAVITGGATADAGATYPASFAATQAIDIFGLIAPDPAHVGRPGRLYTLVMLSDGRRFAQDGGGNFVRFDGDMSRLPARRSLTLGAQEQVSVINGLRGDALGIAGQTVSVYLGYALDTAPQQIWYGRTPIRFSIQP